MKTITALVDFTETSKLAVRFACALAQDKDSKVNLLHIAPTEKDAKDSELESRIVSFTEIEKHSNVAFSVSVGAGNFLKKIPKLVELSEADLVVVGSHGSKGMNHTLFGANVVHLVQSLSSPALVVQDNTPPESIDFKRILFPIAPHDDFEKKTKLTADWVKKYDAEVIIFCLYYKDKLLDEKLSKNLKEAREHFEKEGVKHEVVREESKAYATGYGMEIAEYAAKNDVQLISIMSQVSKENDFFGNVDKTNIVLNKPGIPVLCAV